MTFDAKEREQMDDCRTGVASQLRVVCVGQSSLYLRGVCVGPSLDQSGPYLQLGHSRICGSSFLEQIVVCGDGTREQMQTD